MEEIDINRLSKLYPQLDELTTDEKWKVIDYLKRNLATDNSNTTNVVNKKMDTEVDQKSAELLATMNEPKVSDSNKTEIKEVDEHIERLTSEDITVYIHWCPSWQQIFWELQDRRKDPLLEKGHFNKYYSKLGYNVVFVKDLWNWCVEYTIKRPSCDVIGRSWWYLWLTFILKNWYKIKGTSLPDKNYRDYPLDTDVGDFMDSFMKYLINDCDLVDWKPGSLVKWKYTNEERIRSVLFKVKNTFIRAMNEIEENKWLIVKDKS